MELLQSLEPEDLKAAMESIGGTESKLNDYRQIIKDWMKCQPHLPSDKYDSDIIDIFIRGCKFNLERIKFKLDTYYTIRTTCPELWGDWNPCGDTLKTAMTNFTVIPLPIPLPSGYRVTLHKYLNPDTTTFNYRDLVTLMLLTGDIRLKEEPPLLGDVFIFDVEHFSMSHLTKITLPVMKKVLYCMQNAYPQRLKEIHFVNSSPVVEKLVTLFKTFMKEKMRNRFFIHAKCDTIHEYVPPKYLPVEYGGELPPMADFKKRWEAKLASYKYYFMEQANVKSDESKRKGIANGQSGRDDVFGLEGAFRKLEVD